MAVLLLAELACAQSRDERIEALLQEATHDLEALQELGAMRDRADQLVPRMGRLASEITVELWPTYLRAIGDLLPYVTADPTAFADALQEPVQRVLSQAPSGLSAEIERESTRLRRRAIESRIHFDSELNELVSALNSASPDARILAAELLGYRGSAAQMALPSLRRVLLSSQVSDPGIKFAAAAAMEKIAPSDPIIALALGHRLLHGEEVHERIDAALQLGSFGPDASEAVPQLIEALGEEDQRVVGEVVTALGMLGPAMKRAVPALERLTDHSERQIAERARAGLAQFRRFEAIARGEQQARNAEEQLHAAQFAYGEGWYASSATLYAQALPEVEPPPYFAVAAAARAGIDGDDLDAESNVRWRRQALAWLRRRADSLAQAVNRGALGRARNDLWRMLQAPELAGVRRSEGLARLPEDERAEWVGTWRSLEELCERAWPAYAAYRRGIQYEDGKTSRQNAEMAVKEFRDATQMDPGFAMAYASLAHAHLWLYWHHGFSGQFPLARQALDIAVALEPDNPRTHWAEGFYAYYTRRDYATALKHFELIVAVEPTDSEAIASIAFLQRRTGDYEQAARTLERALELKPLDAGWWLTLGQIYHNLRRYDQAEQAIDRAIELDPDLSGYYDSKAQVELSRDGNTARARKTLEAASERFGEGRFVVRWTVIDIIDGKYQAALDRLATRPNTAGNHLRRARLHGFLGAADTARQEYETAQAMLEGTARTHDQRANLSRAYAGLGRNQEALAVALDVVQRLPVSKDALTGLIYAENLAWIYVQVGDYDSALDQLEFLLSIPGKLSIHLVNTDPRWDRLRHLPRFQELLRK